MSSTLRSRNRRRGGAGPTVVVTKSTVPVGTGDKVEEILRDAERPKTSRSSVVSNPEFLREGAAIGDFKRPDRIVIGSEDERRRAAARRDARGLPPALPQRIADPVRRPAHGELIKYAANAFLATKITFINEIADLCEAVGANVQDVSRAASGWTTASVRSSCTPARLWRVVLSQGHARSAQDGRGLRQSPTRIVEAVVSVNDRAQARDGTQGSRSSALDDGAKRQDGRAARPDLQAQHRRHARRAPRSPSFRRSPMPA